MNDLTPELRADRNGKLVTRHVKSGGRSKSSLGSVPRVDTEADIVLTLRKKVAQHLAMSEFMLSGELDFDRLKALVELTSKHDLSASSKSVVNAFVAMTDDDFKKCIGLLERNLEAAQMILSEEESGDISDASAIVTGLNMNDFSMSPEQERAIVEATCRIWTGGIIENYGNDVIDEMFLSRGAAKCSGTISGGLALREDLSLYIAENPEQVDAVVTMAIKRGISDPKSLDGIGEVLDSVATPLLDGAL